MDHAVLFLVLACKLMLLDGTAGVVVRMCAHHESVLCTAIHCLCIHIVVRLLVLHEPSLFLPCLEILDSLVVGRLAVFVDDRVEINLRLGYMQERLLSCLSLGFGRVEDVVWSCRHFLYILFRRTYRREWTYLYHGSISLP